MSESILVKRFPINTAGRDFAVGDIHGHFTLLQQLLDEVGFNPECDRLFSVGDLVDRGPECERALEWLDKPWFHPVRGNHDDFVCRHSTVDRDNWMYNGGGWFWGLTREEQTQFADWFCTLPLAIEVETPNGPVGLVHADCPFPSWSFLLAVLSGGSSGANLRSIKDECLWSRDRIEDRDTRGVEDVRALVVGHTPVSAPLQLGNVFYIDTMGWRPQRGGKFTLLDLHSLSVVEMAASDS